MAQFISRTYHVRLLVTIVRAMWLYEKHRSTDLPVRIPQADSEVPYQTVRPFSCGAIMPFFFVVVFFIRELHVTITRMTFA